MRVLWLSHFVPYPPVGGAQQRSFHLLRETSEGAEIDMVAIDRSPGPVPADVRDERKQAFLAFCKSYVEFPVPETKRRRVVTAIANLPSSLPVTTPLVYSSKVASYLRNLARDESIDLVHLDTLDLVPYTESLGGIPFTVNHHNVESDLMMRYASSFRNPLLRGYLKSQARRIRRLEETWCHRAAVNLTVSENDGEILSRINGDARFVPVENGVDTEYFFPLPDPGDDAPPTVMWAGQMDWYPNTNAVEFFLEDIWPSLHEACPEVRVLLVGKNPVRIGDYLPGRDRIETPGFVPDVRDYLKRAHVFIVPIRVGGGTRLKILDALSSAKALVSTSVGCEGLCTEDGNHLLVADTPADFREATVRLLRSRDLREKLGRNGRTLVESKYAWPLIGEKVREVYTSIVRAKNHR